MPGIIPIVNTIMTTLNIGLERRSVAINLLLRDRV